MYLSLHPETFTKRAWNSHPGLGVKRVESESPWSFVAFICLMILECEMYIRDPTNTHTMTANTSCELSVLARGIIPYPAKTFFLRRIIKKGKQRSKVLGMSSIILDPDPEGLPQEFLTTGVLCPGYGSFRLDDTFSLLRKRDIPDNQYIKVTVAVCGSVDAGKTTTQAVLSQGYTASPLTPESKDLLDDGCGLVRAGVFNHPHERDSGRTSSVSRMILSYNENNLPGNRRTRGNKNKGLRDWASIIGKDTKKLVTMIDLCGHAKYRKTTISGSMSEVIDYVMITVSANDNGVKTVTCEHILLAISLRVPFFIVMTKVDSMTPGVVVENTFGFLKKWLSLKNIQKTCLLIKTESDIIPYLRNPVIFHEIVPVIQVSNVTGMGIPLLSSFIGCLPVSSSGMYHDKAHDTYSRVTEVYTVRGIGTVVLCCVMSGVIQKGAVMYMGPFHTKPEFRETRVKSIQKNRVNVLSGSITDVITVALSVFHKADVRRGMILVSDPIVRRCSESFTANITVLRHTTTISTGYKPVVYIANVRASAKVTHITKTTKRDTSEDPKLNGQVYLRTRDTAFVRFQFENGSEYIRKGDTIIVNDGNMKATGVIQELETNE